MSANNSKKDDTNLGFNIKSIKDICSKYKKYIATGAMLILLAVVIQSSNAASKGSDDPGSGTPGTTVSDESSAENEKLEVDAYPQLNALFEEYYGYYATGDTASIEKIAFPITDTEKSYIELYSRFVEKYENIKCYTKKGLSEGEYIVMAVADTVYKDVKTAAPGLESFYVRRDEKGNAYIDNIYSHFNETRKENSTEMDINILITEFSQDEEVVALEKEVHEQWDKALEKDEALKETVTETLQSAISEWVASFEDKTRTDDEKDGEGSGKDDSKKDPDKKPSVETRTAYVKSDDVNMRKKRSTSSDVLRVLPAGAEVTVYGESKDGWYKIKYKGDTGFVSEDFIVSDKSEVESENNVEKRTAYVKSDDVNMRKKRSTSSDVLRVLSAGTKVTVYGESKDGWYKVKCKGDTGFVSEDFIVSDKSKVDKEDNSKKRVAYAKEGVNMRKSRSTDSKVIKTLKAGTKVMIYGKSKNGWFRVRSKGKFGYVKKEYIVTDKSKVIKDEEPDQGSSSSPATRYFNEGDRITLTDSVNVRQSMSETADRVGLAYQGDVLTVIMSYAEGWTKVSWNGQTGYVKTELLK